MNSVDLYLAKAFAQANPQTTPIVQNVLLTPAQRRKTITPVPQNRINTPRRDSGCYIPASAAK